MSFVFNDIMGLERLTKHGVLPDDIISAIKGHIKDGYEVRSNRNMIAYISTWHK